MTQDITNAIRSNSQGNWLSHRGPVTSEVQGFYIGCRTTAKGLALDTTGGTVYWPMDKATANDVVQAMTVKTAA